MPIRPENRHRYPRDWKQIRARILERAQHRCEDCGVPNHAWRWRDDAGGEHWMVDETRKTHAGAPGIRVTRIVLTIAHLDHHPEHCADENLRAWCQRCHLRYDQQHHLQTAYQTRRAGLAVRDLFA